VAAGAAGVVLDAAPGRPEDKKAVEDSKLSTENVTFMNGSERINAFLARPKAPDKYGAVLVVPDIFGMTPYIRETTAQLAQAGFAALAVDFYRRMPPSNDIASLRAFIAETAPDRQIVSDMQAGL